MDIQGHVLKIKVNGKWMEIPVAYTDIYDAYCAYCNNNGVVPVTQEQYYVTLGSLNDILSAIQNIVKDAKALQALSDALSTGDGILPLSLGGTGKKITEHNDFEEYIASLINVEDIKASAKEAATTAVNGVAINKLDKNAISVGTTAPNENTQGSFYFQYEE